MKSLKIFAVVAVMALVVMTGCKKPAEPVHTNASLAFTEMRTFVGDIYEYEATEPMADKATVTIQRVEADSVETVSIHITCPAFQPAGKSASVMDQTAVFNVGQAGEGRYTFSNGSTTLAQTASSGLLDGKNLTMYLSLTSAGKFSKATNMTKTPYKFVLVEE